jgi:hypothetical protein
MSKNSDPERLRSKKEGMGSIQHESMKNRWEIDEQERKREEGEHLLRRWRAIDEQERKERGGGGRAHIYCGEWRGKGR